jgi:hypothetical protein
MKVDKLLLELEEIVSQLGYRLRKERGNFRGANCVLEGERMIMLNKNQPAELHTGTLAKFILAQKHEDIFIKPAVRKELDKLWDRIAATTESELNFDAND